MNTSQHTSWKFISFLLVFVLVSAGCSGRTPSGTNVPPSSGSEGEGTTITFAAYGYQRQFFEALMETFHEQNPEITVQFVDLNQVLSTDQMLSPGEEWNPHTYLRSLVQAADTVMIEGPFIFDPTTDMSRYFRNLQPLYESDSTFQPDDFWPGILTSCEDTYGNMVGLPLTASMMSLFYDQAAFDAAGLPYPQPGWTWDDFQKAVTALSEKKGGETRYGFYDMPDLGGSILASLISNHFASHAGEVDADGLLNEVKWYIDLGRAGMLSGVKAGEDMQNAWDERMKLFEDDSLRPAMWIDSLISYLPSTEVFYNPDNPFSGTAIDRFGVAPFPVSTNGSANQTSRSWTECAAISAGTTQPRASWAWLNFLSRHWFVRDKTQIYELGRAPSRQSVAESEGYWDLMPAKAIPAVRFTLEHGFYSFNYIGQFSEINIALAKTISQNADFVQVFESEIDARPATPTPFVDDAPIVVATPRAPLPEGVTAIKYYIGEYNQTELSALNALVDQYNQRSSDTHVSFFMDFSANPEEDWYTAMARNFDCFTAGQFGFTTSQVLNLNSLLSNEPASFVSDFSPQMMDRFRLEGNLYALPASSRVQMMAYNADLLARRGQPIPTNDWTFDDFIELASAAASTSDADPSYGYMYSPYDDFISLGKGIKWVDMESDPPQVNFDSPEIQAYMKWLINMNQERVLFNQENNWEKMNTIMYSGQLAFWTAMMGEKDWFFQGSGQQIPFKIGMVPMPRIEGDNPMASWSNDRGHYISAQSENPRACWDWIKFLSEQPNLFAGLPARLSIAESPTWEAAVGKDDATAYRAAIANIKPLDQNEFDPQSQFILWAITDWRNQAILAALEGQEIQPLLIAAQQKAEAYLDCALALDSSRPSEELSEEYMACRRQADPDGNY